MNLNGFFNSSKENFDKTFIIVSALIVFVRLVMSFVLLSNNLIFSDEGWYLCLMKDLPHYGSTRFHLLFNNVFNNNIYAIRVSCWLSQIVGGLVFSIGFCSYFGNNITKHGKWAVILVFCALFWNWGLRDIGCFYYNNLKVVFTEFGVGLMLIGLSKEKTVYLVLSGFFIAFLFPVMITNVVFIPLMFMALMMLSRKMLKNGLSFVAGICLFAIYYFVFVESPKEVFESLLDETQKVVNNGGNEYGLSFLVAWIEDAIMYLCKCAFVAIALYGVSYVAKKRIDNNLARWGLLFGTSFLILWYSWRYVAPVTNIIRGQWLYDIRWILLFLLSVFGVMERTPYERKEIVVMTLLVLSTVCLSFGSNIDFNKHTEVIPFLDLALMYFIIKRSYKWKIVLFGVVFAAFILFLSSISGYNWYWQKWIGKHESVETIGISQNVKLERKYIDMLVYCRDKVPQGRVLNSPENWGQVVLLGYIPISYEYDISRNGMKYLQNIVDKEVEEEGHLWILSHVWKKKFNENIQMLNGYEITIDTAFDNIYYYVTPNENLKELH